MTAEEANTANLSAMNMRSSNRSEHASPDGLRNSQRFDFASSAERASARELSDRKFGGSSSFQGAGSVDNGPALSFQLRPPPPEGEGGASSMRSSLRSSESESRFQSDGEASDGGSPPLSPSKQKTKTKRFRERRLSKDLQDVLGTAGFESGQEGSVAAAGLAAQQTSLLQAAGSGGAVVDGEGEPSFKGSDDSGQGSFKGMNGMPLSPMKKTMRLDIGKSGLPVDKGYNGGRGSVTISTEIEDLVDDAVTPFERSLVGTYSCHGAEPTDAGSIAKINQDCASISHPLARTPGTALFCVYDGHGKFGHHVSQEVSLSPRLCPRLCPCLSPSLCPSLTPSLRLHLCFSRSRSRNRSPGHHPSPPPHPTASPGAALAPVRARGEQRAAARRPSFSAGGDL